MQVGVYCPVGNRRAGAFGGNGAGAGSYAAGEANPTTHAHMRNRQSLEIDRA